MRQLGDTVPLGVTFGHRLPFTPQINMTKVMSEQANFQKSLDVVEGFRSLVSRISRKIARSISSLMQTLFDPFGRSP